MKWLTIDTACEILGIKPASVYSYVSRGLVRARTGDGDPRSSLYAGADIDQLMARKRTGRKRDSIARGAIGWGEPILESGIATVLNGKLIFRGLDAIALSHDYTLEAVASLLWGDGGIPPASQCTDIVIATTSKAAGLSYLADQAAVALPCPTQSRSDLARQAGFLMEGLSHSMALGHPGVAAHHKLAAMWKLKAGQADILRRTLVLLADHELNPSTFGARVAASTGASLAACALSGFATLTGPYHGEAAAGALDFLAEAQIAAPTQVAALLAGRPSPVPGLGHKLYPDGDPRALALMQVLDLSPKVQSAIKDAELFWGAKANIDMALAALTLSMGLPRTAPFTLFAVARMAGWLAHGVEQGLSGALIRPRARYVGL